MNSHFYNETEKRLEPQGCVCAFCGNEEVTNPQYDYYTYLYRTESRFNAIVYRNVKFKKIEIGATRCKDCQKKHFRNSIYSMCLSIIAFIIISVIIAGIAYLMIESLHPIIGIVFGTILLVCNIHFCCDVIYVYFHKILANKLGIKSPHEGLKTYQIVQEFIKEGFKFNQPLA